MPTQLSHCPAVTVIVRIRISTVVEQALLKGLSALEREIQVRRGDLERGYGAQKGQKGEEI